MNIQAQKIELAQMIFETDDKSVLKKIKALLAPEPDLLDTLHDEVKKSVEVSMKQLKEGKGIPHHEVMKKVRKWQQK